MKRLIILNPQSRHGTAGQRFEKQRDHWEERLGSFDLYLTKAPGDATVRVRAALENCEFDQIIVAGGDGSINEAFRGYWESGRIISSEIPLGVINLGTGGDFFRTVTGCSDGYEEALIENRFRMVDAARVTDPQGIEHPFLNIASVGLAGEMLRRLKSSKFQNGSAAYFYHTLRTLLAYAPRSAELELVDREGKRRSQRVDVLNLFVCNGRFSGGGMLWAPDAQLDSGSLRVTLIGGRKKWPLIRRSRMLYSGEVAAFPGAETFEASEIILRCGEIISLETDGEIIDTTVDDSAGIEIAFGVVERVFPLVL